MVLNLGRQRRAVAFSATTGRLFLLVVAGVILALVVAACGEEEDFGGSGSDGDASAAAGASDETDETPTPNSGDDSDSADSGLPPKYVVESATPEDGGDEVSLVAYGIEPMAGMDALIQGQLAVSNGCVGVQSEFSDEFTHVVWPYGYTLEHIDGVPALVDANGEVVATVGDRISMGGGNSPDDGTLEAIAPDGCVADSYWLSSSSVQQVTEGAAGPDSATDDPGDEVENTPVVQSPEDALKQDAQMYAEEHGISLDEAIRRLKLQELPGPLQQTLMENEADRFGGLYIEHKPEFRVVVLMTDGDEEAVRSYIDNPELNEIVEVETVEVSYKELQGMQEEAVAILQDLGTMFTAGIDVRENQIEISAPDAAKLKEAIEAAGHELPEHVVIQEREQPETMESN